MASEMQEKMLARLDNRQAFVNARFDKLRRLVRSGRLGGEEGRIWLEKFAVGQGLNLCCGDFSIGDSVGVDADRRVVATDLLIYADQMCEEPNSQDFIVTNYLECFGNTLSTLMGWQRILKSGGVLAIVCANADLYENARGPLENQHRMSCFNLNVLRCLLARAGFKLFEWQTEGKELRVAARKE